MIEEEICDIYYRTSDRVGWTLMGSTYGQRVIDDVNLRLSREDAAEIPLKEQRYQFVRMPDNTSLPEYNEIQFRFVPKNGFSIISSWFEYSYITRNTVR